MRKNGPACILLIVGVLVRTLYAFPAHRYLGEADAMLTGLRAFDVLRGKWPVFYSGLRNGALESYLHAAVFAMFGSSRGTLAIAPLFAGCSTMVVFLLFVREIFEPSAAAFALALFAFPSAGFLEWAYQPVGYSETILFGVIALWLAARTVTHGPSIASLFGMGTAIGLGWWNSPLSLGCTLPALGWMAVGRPDSVRPRRSLLLIGGCALGALPWIAYNVIHPLASFRKDEFLGSARSDLTQKMSNLRYVAVHEIANLIFPSRAPCAPPRNVSPLADAIILVSVLAGVAALFAEIARGRRDAESASRFRAATLLALLVGTILILDAFSVPGRLRGPGTYRYILPLSTVLPALLALPLAALGRRSRPAAWAGVILIVAVEASAYCWPWRRTDRREAAIQEDRLARHLEDRGIRYVIGDYWDVYPITFLTRERVAGIPTAAQLDGLGYGARLGEIPAPFAIVSQSPGAAAEWGRRAVLPGETRGFGSRLACFIPATNPPAMEPPQSVIRRLARLDPAVPTAAEASARWLTAPVPTSMTAGALYHVAVDVRNTGAASWAETPAPGTTICPVFLAYHWLHEGGALYGHGQRSSLGTVVAPGEQVHVPDMTIAAPREPGRYLLKLDLVQENVRWFQTGPPAIPVIVK